MKNAMDRREFLTLMGIGGVVFVSGLGPLAHAAGEKGAKDDFFFVQMSDTHWGFADPKVNPDFSGTLKKSVAMVNSLSIGAWAGRPQPRARRVRGARRAPDALRPHLPD